jgi:hypothetical protein
MGTDRAVLLLRLRVDRALLHRVAEAVGQRFPGIGGPGGGGQVADGRSGHGPPDSGRRPGPPGSGTRSGHSADRVRLLQMRPDPVADRLAVGQDDVGEELGLELGDAGLDRLQLRLIR